MALVIADRVRETTSSTGTGTITLTGPFSGFQPFSVIGNGNTTYYCIIDSSTGAFEVGIGTYTTSGNTLSRTTVLSSSNSNNLVNFVAGVKDVICTQPSARAVYVDGTNIVAANSATLPITTVGGLGTGVATFLATPSSANLAAALTDETGTGAAVFATSPTLVTPALGTPSALVGTNITGTATAFTSSNVTTNANLTGAVTSTGNATLLGSFTSAQLAGALTDETGTGALVFATSPTLVTPALGTPASGVVTNLTGTASININGTVGATTPATGAFTSVNASLDSAFNSTGSLTVAKGTTAQRPGTPVSGMFRFNTTTAEFEGYNGTAFASVGGAALSNDTTTATSLFPLFATATSGTASSLFTSNAQYLFKPSIGELSAKGIRGSNGILTNSATVSANATIATGDNAMSIGPITLNSGVTVTVSSGSRYVVI